jgi:hypothetical protein
VGKKEGKMKKLLIFGFITLFILVSFNAAEAAPLPATTQVDKKCQVMGPTGWVLDQYNPGSQQYEQNTTCYLSGAEGTAQGYASALFGPGIPQIGLTSTSATITAPTYAAEADFVASITYRFEIQPIGQDPGISQIPVLFSADGQGNAITGTGSTARTAGYVDLIGNGLSYGDANFVFDLYLTENQVIGGAFSDTKNLNLYPSNSYGTNTYTVIMSAVSEAYGLSASSTAAVDPFIGFDQAAFDAMMGSNTFALNQYYMLVFSTNLPLPQTAVPEPSTPLLLGSGLLGLIGFRKKRKN